VRLLTATLLAMLASAALRAQESSLLQFLPPRAEEVPSETEQYFDPAADLDQQNEAEPAEDEPWALLGDNRWLDGHDLAVRFWLAQGFTANAHSPSDRSNGTLGMNDRADEYQFSQLGFFAERAVDTEAREFAAGGRVEMLYGTDARFAQSLGLDDTWYSGRFVALAMPQLYGEVFLPLGGGLDVKVGRFWSPLGIEGVPAADRFFYSTVNVYMYGQPSCQTGILGQYTASQRASLLAGLTRGWDVWEDNNSALNALGGVYLSGREEESELILLVSYGSESNQGNDRQFVFNSTWKRPLDGGWSYMLTGDLGVAADVARDAFGLPEDAQWWGVANYLFCQLGDRWKAGGRFEVFHDDDGVRIRPFERDEPLGRGTLYALTLGLNYLPSANLIIRPEARCDWAAGLSPFDDETSAQQFTAAIDAIVRF
jgi:putative OmpL-like beta-barrel porin-2